MFQIEKLTKVSLAVVIITAISLFSSCNGNKGGGAATPVTVTVTTTTGAATVTASLSSPTGNTVIGSSKTLTLTVANSASSTASISGISLSGLTSVLTQSSNTCASASVAPGASCTIAILYTPVAIATTSVTASLAYTVANSGGNGSLSVAISESSYGIASVSASVNSAAGSTAAGSTKDIVVTVTNSSSATLAASSVALTSVSAPYALQSSTCSTSIAVGASCVLTYRFSPTVSGTFTAAPVMSYAVGDGTTANLTINLSESATGVASLSASVSSPAGNTAVSSTKDITVTVTNSGAATSAASSLSLTGISAPFTQQSTTCGSTLAIGASCTYTIRFSPTTETTSTASGGVSYQVGNGTSSSAPFNLSEVSQNGAVVTISVPSAGSTAYGSTRDVTLTVSNSSVAASAATGLNLGAMALSGPDSARYAVQSTTCSGTLNINASCNYVVRFTSPGAGTFGATATLTFDPGTGSNTTATGTLAEVGTAQAITVGAIVNDSGVTWTNGAKWNDYIQASTSAMPVAGWNASTVFGLANTACNAASYPQPWQCVHAGELRSAALTGSSSCSGLTYSDTLGAFNWVCTVISGTTYIRSLGLKSGKGLRDLVDSSGWKANQLTVSDGTYTIYQSSAASAWWTNAVDTTTFASNISSTSPTTLTTASKIYVIPNTITMSGRANIEIQAAKIALVTLPGKKLKFSHTLAPAGNSNQRIRLENYAHGWIEVDMKDISTEYGYLIANYSRQSRIHNAVIDGNYNLSYYGVLVYAEGIRITETTFANTAYEAVYGANPVNMHDVKINNCGHSGNSGSIALMANFNTLARVQITGGSGNAVAGLNTGYGAIRSSGSTYNALAFLSFFNNATSGLRIENGGAPGYTTVSQLLAINNGSAGLVFKQSSNNYATAIASSRSARHGISTISSDVNYSGTVLLGGNAISDCNAYNITGNGLDSGCANVASSTAAVTTSRDLAGAIVGKISSDDTVNEENSYTSTGSAVADFSHYETPYRAWGRSGTAALDSSTMGALVNSDAGTIWDYRLESSDAAIFNYNGSFTANGACPASVDGTVTVTDQSSRVYLINAMELAGYGGNNNGLCESGESCVYQPHFGAYAGEGTPTDTCAFADGPSVTGVTMYVYPTLGI